MPTLGSKLLIAFDASGVSGAVVSRGLGRRRVRSFARVPLPAGALVPAALDPNLRGAQEVRDALARVRETLRGGGREASLILPDGLARTMLLDIPEGSAPHEFARFRLVQGLAYPPDEAVVDLLPLDRGRALAVAVRRSVIEEYEAAAAAAGFVQADLNLAPLTALAALMREAAGPGGGVDLILGDAAFSLAAFQGGALRIFRSRRRDPGPDEAERLRDEIQRTAALAGNGGAPRVRVVGPGTGALVARLESSGWSAEAGWDAARDGLPIEPAELAWFGATGG